jgi:hypothetical protein
MWDMNEYLALEMPALIHTVLNRHFTLSGMLLKRCILWDIIPCSPVKTDVSEEHIDSIFRI